jgi:hypothetical protein
MSENLGGVGRGAQGTGARGKHRPCYRLCRHEKTAPGTTSRSLRGSVRRPWAWNAATPGPTSAAAWLATRAAGRTRIIASQAKPTRSRPARRPSLGPSFQECDVPLKG